MNIQLQDHPYAHLVRGCDPLDLMERTPARYESLVTNWTHDAFRRSYAPGKWSAAQLLVHLAQVEVASGNRIRLALTIPNYVVQPWDADDWMSNEADTDARTALGAYLALRRFNLRLYRGIPVERRMRVFAHPEVIALSIDRILHTIAGHDLHHLQHLETIAAICS